MPVQTGSNRLPAPAGGNAPGSAAGAGLPLETVACYICGRTDGAVLLHDPPFRVLRCAGCGLGYTSPRIAASRVHEIYSDAYFRSDSARDYGYTDYARDRRAYTRTFEKRADVIAPFVAPGGRILDVGCAAGFFLDVMRRRGHAVTGVEVSHGILRTARELFDLPDLHSGRLSDAPLAAGSYDLVTLWDVIEHLPDPLSELAIVHRLLREDGVLVLQTQDLSSRFARLLGRRWHHFKQAEHLYHFDPATVRALLSRAGFQVLHVTRKAAGKHVSPAFIAERSARISPLLRILLSPLLLLRRFYLYINPGDEIIVVARRLPSAPASGPA